MTVFSVEKMILTCCIIEWLNTSIKLSINSTSLSLEIITMDACKAFAALLQQRNKANKSTKEQTIVTALWLTAEIYWVYQWWTQGDKWINEWMY